MKRQVTFSNPWYAAFTKAAPKGWSKPWVKWGGGQWGTLIDPMKKTMSSVKVLKKAAGGPSGTLVYTSPLGRGLQANPALKAVREPIKCVPGTLVHPKPTEHCCVDSNTGGPTCWSTANLVWMHGLIVHYPKKHAGLRANPCPNGCRKDNFGRCTNARCSNYGKQCNGDCTQKNPRKGYFTRGSTMVHVENPTLSLSKTPCPAGTVLTPVVTQTPQGPKTQLLCRPSRKGFTSNPASLAKTPCPAGTVLTPVVTQTPQGPKTQLLCRPAPKGFSKTPCPAGTVLTPVVKDGKTALLCRPKTQDNPRQQNPGCPTCPGYSEAQKAWNWYNSRRGPNGPKFNRMVITK